MEFEIWSEGFAATGENGEATLHGIAEAENFKEACDYLFETDDTYDPKDLTYWGCKLYDNETDARRAFG